MKKLTLGFVFVAGLAVALQAATITKITGNPEVAPPSSLEWQKAQRNMKIGDNTKLRCGPGSKAELITNNGHKIKVWPKSEISLDKVDGETSKFSLFLGKIRSIVKKLKGREKFEVKTPVAVCSVRGTDFAVEIGEENQMLVEVYEGQVAAQEEMTGAEVIVNAGEFTQVFQN
ncbi:MAG: FecR domain-containing protein, partial [Endomicrobiales bacterium]|nr:FecR domain-containing protein [Endomicrobiales bacterium]